MMAKVSGWSGTTTTPIATVTPTPIPTPTVIIATCQLTSASWSIPGNQTLITPQNTTVNLNVAGDSNCANKQVI